MPPGTSTSGDASTSTSTSTSSAEDSAAASSASHSSTSSASSGIPDGGTPPDGGDKPPPGCMGKVDLVFSISSRWTMKGAQDWLKASFPGFIDTLETEFAGFDYHILVPMQGSGVWGIPSCKGCVDTCPAGPEDYPCGAALEPCDTVQGAGITFSAGWDASNERCDLAGGHRYITAAQPDLASAFTCVASVGTSGGGLVAEAAVSTLRDEINAPAGCNAGFLRDDALLVVVAIDDTWDEDSEGTAQDWADALVEAKGGDADAVVLLVITNDIDDPDGLCGYEGVPPAITSSAPGRSCFPIRCSARSATTRATPITSAPRPRRSRRSATCSCRSERLRVESQRERPRL
ncbi:hypothetical protein OV079_27855 [Nannocystis pusilla]|uniref:Uncharacterized protein n=1 Tax=Nannocystis pusilla TaxID=889268 RepID=A0A9X3IZ94_9BACT|nr:hypothetical protein [Nannocystis pusilla]MCY1009311.1 hypothetical protein [Nannocystis pusilla]